METLTPRIDTLVGRRSVLESALDRKFQNRSIVQLQEYLKTCGPIVSLAILLRVGRRYLAELRATPRQGMWWSLPDILSRSLYGVGDSNKEESPLARLTAAWREVVGVSSPWSDVVALPATHACILRGPSVSFQKLFALDFVHSESTPVSGVIPPTPMIVPEHRFLQLDGSSAESEAFLDTIQALMRLHEIPELDHEQIGRTLMEEFISNRDRTEALDNLTAAMSWGRGDNRRQKLLKLLALIASERPYVDELGIGRVSALGENAGIGRTVSVIDSGLDESLPIFHGKVDHYARVDPIGHEKKAHDSTDTGCHGTKMGSIICSRSMSLKDFGITEEYVATVARTDLRKQFGISNESPVRFAIAPGAKLDVRSVLSGEYGCETSQIPALASVIESVVKNPRISVVNISIEANASRYPAELKELGINRSLLLATETHKAVIVAAGNHGPNSAPMGQFLEDRDTGKRVRVAYVVGAADRKGTTKTVNNGPEFDFLATGVDVLCAQPIRSKLDNEMLVAYSGSSLATAIVSGCVAALSTRFENSTPVDICEALFATQRADRMINIDAAASTLGGPLGAP